MKVILALTAVGFIIAACTAETISATPRSIMLKRVSESNLADATEKAQGHCARYDRDAEMIPDDKADGRVTFRCVDR